MVELAGDLLSSQANDKGRGFSEYYRIGSDDRDESDAGQEEEGEARGRVIGLDSPFGVLGKLKVERGLTHEELLWGQSWASLVLESMDQPHYDPKAPKEEVEAEDGLNGVIDKLNKKR